MKEVDKMDLHNYFKEIPDDLILNPDDISKMLKMSSETVRRWCRKGNISCYNFGGKYIVLGSDFKEFMINSKRLSNAENEMNML